MSKICASVILAALICWAALICSAPPAVLANAITPGPEEPREVDVPSEEFSSIGSAIDALPSGSTIRLGPQRYTEAVTIVGKTLHIVGNGMDGHDATEMRSDDPAEAVITFGPGGGGSVRDMKIRNGAFGIKGKKGSGNGGDALPASVLIKQVHILHVGQGIFGSFSDLAVHDSIIRHVDWNGICAIEITGLELLNDLVADATGTGLLVFNIVESDEPIRIIGTKFQHNDWGGLAIVGSAQDVEIIDCEFWNNKLAGILLLEVGQVAVRDTEIKRVRAAKAPGFSSEIAEGLLAKSEVSEEPEECSSFVEVDNCLVHTCDRAGIHYINCDGLIQNTVSKLNKYGLVIQGPPIPLSWDRDNTFVHNAVENVFVGGGDYLPVPDGYMPLPEYPG